MNVIILNFLLKNVHAKQGVFKIEVCAIKSNIKVTIIPTRY